MKNIFGLRFIIGFLFLFFPARCFAITVQEVMEAVIANIKGPPGKMVVASGVMTFPGRKIDVRIARYVGAASPSVIESFQADLFATEEGGANRKYRVIWEGNNISAFAFIPSMHRGRILDSSPTSLLDGIYGSEYPTGLLPFMGVLLSFSYSPVMEEQDGTFRIEGKRIPGGVFPFSRVRLIVGRHEMTYVLLQAAYTTDRGDIMQRFKEYGKVEGAPGYFAPRKVLVGNTLFTFTRWRVIEPTRWILSKDHGVLGTQNIP